MKFIELFAGLGGLGYGLQQAGMECVGFVECDTQCTKCKEYTQHQPHPTKEYTTVCQTCGTAKTQPTHMSYQMIHDPRKEMWSAYDVTTVTDDTIRGLRDRGIQLIAAGFPCQSFSVAGRRQGFADRTRGTLFFEVVRFASILRPKYLLLENVDGLRNHDGGRTLGIILSTLDEMGYMGGWQVLNSKDHGVPQNRERIFIVASLGDGRAREVFPFGRENSNSIKIAGMLGEGFRQINEVLDPSGISTCLRTFQGGGLEPKVLVAGHLESDSGGTGKVYKPTGIAPTQLSQHGNAVTKIAINTTNHKMGKPTGIANALLARNYKGLANQQEMTVVMESDKRIAGWVENDDKIFAYQGDAKRSTVQESVIIKPQGKTDAITVGHTPKTLQGYRIRKLTPLECFRLQSWPDMWYVQLKLYRHSEYIDQVDMSRNDITAQVLSIIADNGLKEGISDSQLYKQAGNGVTSIVTYEIGKRLNEINLK